MVVDAVDASTAPGVLETAMPERHVSQWASSATHVIYPNLEQHTLQHRLSRTRPRCGTHT